MPTYLALQTHNDELLRELTLLAGRPDQPGEPGPPAAARRVARELARLHPGWMPDRELVRSQVSRARSEGRQFVDVRMTATPDLAEQLREVVRLLEQADDLCRRRQLLTEPAAPAAASLRRWITRELQRQVLDGLPPSAPWSPDTDTHR